jgi:hypothetical protein
MCIKERGIKNVPKNEIAILSILNLGLFPKTSFIKNVNAITIAENDTLFIGQLLKNCKNKKNKTALTSESVL